MRDILPVALQLISPQRNMAEVYCHWLLRVFTGVTKMATSLFLFCVVSGLSTFQGARNEGKLYCCVFKFVFLPNHINCTSGFPSRERMNAVLNRPNSHQTDTQAIIPFMNFTCNGRISSWIFAANLRSTNSTPFTELQIWRREHTGDYKKVEFWTREFIESLLPQSCFSYGVSKLDISYQSKNKHRILFGRVNSVGVCRVRSVITRISYHYS